MSKENDSVLLKEIPGSAIKRSDAANYIKNVLNEQLPRSDRTNLEKELKWSYLLDKRSDVRIRNENKRKRNYLTRKERASNHLLKLSKSGWNYSALQEMRDMWLDYMRENLESINLRTSLSDGELQSLNLLLSKTEYVGAEIDVVRSRCPSMVDIKGTIVLETKNTFQIVTNKSELKVLPKADSVFAINVNDLQLTIFGKHLITKPAERSVKKVKLSMMPDI